MGIRWKYALTPLEPRFFPMNHLRTLYGEPEVILYENASYLAVRSVYHPSRYCTPITIKNLHTSENRMNIYRKFY